MLGPGLITIIVVVAVVIFVGVILAFVFTTRSVKGPNNERNAPKTSGDQNNNQPEQAPVTADPRKTVDLRDSKDDTEAADFQLVLDDDRKIPFTLPCSIGRSKENTIEISDPTISSTHARVYFDHRIDAVCIEDLDSTNGLFVDGKPTIRCILDDGARLTIGDVSMVFRKAAIIPPSP